MFLIKYSWITIDPIRHVWVPVRNYQRIIKLLDDSKITVGRDLLCLFLNGAVS